VRSKSKGERLSRFRTLVASSQSPRSCPFVQPAFDQCGNAWARPTVAERKSRAAHRCASFRIAEQSPGFRNNALAIRTHENCAAFGDSFWPFGLVTQHEQWNSDRRGLLLNATGIAENKVGISHALKQLAMAARVKKAHPLHALEQASHAHRDKFIRVKHDVDFCFAIGKRDDGSGY
jgi:hypothetical protein